jgi:hypothetical protein
MSSRIIGSGRVREGGKAAVHLHDFKSHYQGDDFRHGATQTDMDPPIPTFANIFNAPTVQETLEKMAAFLSTVGQGYITIGDGYDTGNYNAPPLDVAFTAALTNPRLQNGGVILVKSGTYRLNNTVNIPPGITVMGEPRGTYIFGDMGELPMFNVEKSQKQFLLGTLAGNPFYASDTTDQVKFYDLILGDNTDGYVSSGATMTTVPMIRAEVGSNLSIERVTFLGYLDAGQPPTTCTHRAVGYTGASPGKPTTLHIERCFFDGLKSAVEFTPAEGSLNSLRVEKSRAYLLGNPTSGNVQDTCFVSFVLCNAHFEGNEHYGLGGFQDRCFALLPTTATNPNVRVNIINNSGSLSSSLTYSQAEVSNFFTNDNTTQTFECVNIGNNWGLNLNNDFFYTVGDGVNSVGDLVGPNALDIAIQRSAIGSGFGIANANVIVNCGKYDMTLGDLNSKVNLIGNAKAGEKPYITLMSASGALDQAGNPTQGIGHYTSDITFSTPLASPFQSVTIVAGDTTISRTQVVKNCSFENCGLYFQDTTSADPFKISQIINSCNFYQDGTFTDNVSFYTNGANLVLLENCFFSGNGYTVGIGSATPFTAIAQEIVIRNCQMLMANDGLVAKRISDLSPLGASNYIFIKNVAANIFIEDTMVLAGPVGSTFVSTDVITGPILNDGDFDKFINITGKDVKILNSTIVGQSSTYDNGGTAYQLPTLFIEPAKNLIISSSHIEGMLPLQVSGTSSGQNSKITLKDSNFFGPKNSTKSITCVDLDLKQMVVSTPFPKIIISGCSLYNNVPFSSTGNTPLEHINNTGVNFNTLGLLMVMAPGWETILDNTTIFGTVGDTVIAPFSIGSAAFVDVGNSINISNCPIGLFGFQNDGNIAHGIFVCLLRGSNISVHNNIISYAGFAGGSVNNYNSYLLIDASSPNSISNVSGNAFSGQNAGFGIAVAVVKGTFAGSSGVFVDNTFDHVETNSVIDRLFFQDDTGIWNIERNKNQTKSIFLKGNRGQFGLGGPGGLVNIGDFSLLNIAGCYIYFSDIYHSPPLGSTKFIYKSANQVFYVWEISLDEALPSNVSVIKAVSTVTSSTLFSLRGDFNLEMFSAANLAGTYKDSVDLTTVLSGIATVTPINPQIEFKTGKELMFPSIVVTLNAESSSDSDVNFFVLVDYRW